MVYALRKTGQIDLLEVIPGQAHGSYLFKNSDGREGTWSGLTGLSTTSQYRNQFWSVQGTVRCTGCHTNLNLASEWAAETLGTWRPRARSYGLEFKGKFNHPPAAILSQPEFDFACYGGEPCFAHINTHYYPEKVGGLYTGKPIAPQPQPWPLLPIAYQKYIVDRYGEPPRALGGQSVLSPEEWLRNARRLDERY